jgi:hypothetical protein
MRIHKRIPARSPTPIFDTEHPIKLQEFEWSLIQLSEFLTMTPPSSYVQQCTTHATCLDAFSHVVEFFSFSNRIMLFLRLSLIHGDNLTTCAQKLLMPMMASRLMVQVTFIMNLYLHCLLHRTMSFLPSSKDIRLFHLSRSRQPMAHTYSHTYHFLPIIWRHNHLIMGENLICHTGVWHMWNYLFGILYFVL